ncbi:MAG: acyltransferase family protein, partial [Bacteroidales bacterium]
MEEKRYNNIDISKGIGIFLVVYGHFGGIPNLNPSYFSVLYQFVYTFHMPLFMALSGFLFGKLFSEDFSYKSFIIKKAKRLIIPYITYSLLLFIIKYAAGFFVTLKYPLLLNDAIYFILVQPNIGFASFLWFIYTLFLIFCIVPFFKKINHLFIISLILYFIPFPPYFCIGLVAKYLIYFTIGIYMYRYILSDKKTKRPFAVFVFTSLL